MTIPQNNKRYVYEDFAQRTVKVKKFHPFPVVPNHVLIRGGIRKLVAKCFDKSPNWCLRGSQEAAFGAGSRKFRPSHGKGETYGLP
jgi:hypothetical protein